MPQQGPQNAITTCCIRVVCNDTTETPIDNTSSLLLECCRNSACTDLTTNWLRNISCDNFISRDPYGQQGWQIRLDLVLELVGIVHGMRL